MSRNRTILAVAVAASALASAAGCSHGHTSSAGHAAVSSLTANPAYQADKARLQAELLANFKKEFKPTHPVTSMMTAVRDTFPNGSTSEIVNYAVKTFTLKASHRGAAQDTWIQGVVTYALSLGQSGVGTSTAQPVIPGTTSSPSAAPSASHT